MSKFFGPGSYVIYTILGPFQFNVTEPIELGTTGYYHDVLMEPPGIISRAFICSWYDTEDPDYTYCHIVRSVPWMHALSDMLYRIHTIDVLEIADTAHGMFVVVHTSDDTYGHAVYKIHSV